MPEILNIEQKIDEYRIINIQNTIRSIQRDGIIPSNEIKEDCQPIFILGSAERDIIEFCVQAV